MTDYSSDANKKFDLIQFYDNQKYDIKSVSIIATNA
jgi:hypothetical protein